MLTFAGPDALLPSPFLELISDCSGWVRAVSTASALQLQCPNLNFLLHSIISAFFSWYFFNSFLLVFTSFHAPVLLQTPTWIVSLPKHYSRVWAAAEDGNPSGGLGKGDARRLGHVLVVMHSQQTAPFSSM